MQFIELTKFDCCYLLLCVKELSADCAVLTVLPVLCAQCASSVWNPPGSLCVLSEAVLMYCLDLCVAYYSLEL